MAFTRPQRARMSANTRFNRLWGQIADDIPVSQQKKLRRAIQGALQKQAEHVIDIYTYPADTEGVLILLRTDIKGREDVFRVIATNCPDYRLTMADREIPLDSLIEVARFPVDRVRTAGRLVLERLEARNGVDKIHSHYFKTPGGAKSMRGLVERVACRVNGVAFFPPVVRPIQVRPRPSITPPPVVREQERSTRGTMH